MIANVKEIENKKEQEKTKIKTNTPSKKEKKKTKKKIKKKKTEKACRNLKELLEQMEQEEKDLIFIPSAFKKDFNSGISISPKWKTLAAKAASAFPLMNASLKWRMFPAPPLAIIGMGSFSCNSARASMAKPFFTPSWFMLVKRISPAPRSATSDAHSINLRSVGIRPPFT